MNENQFDANLKAAFPTQTVPAHLSHKIDHAVQLHKNRRQMVSRLTLSLGTGVAVVAGIVLFPAVKAQASMSGIINALDKQTSVRITTYMIGESGERAFANTTIIANGDSVVSNQKGVPENISKGKIHYYWDPTIKSYVTHPRVTPASLRLSDMLGPASKFSPKKRVELENISINGREIVRATIENGDLPERYVIEADAKTQLPFHVRVESLERGNWRQRQDILFDYVPGLTVAGPDKSKPVITAEESDIQFQSAMTQKALGQAPLAYGKRVVVRKLDVAEDGTVFVCFQTGEQPSGTPMSNSWNGYKINLTDNLGTSYRRLGDLYDTVQTPKKTADGKLQLEIFLPLKPISVKKARTINLSVMLDHIGRLGVLIPTQVARPDGTKIIKNVPGTTAPQKEVTIFNSVFREPTCQSGPNWVSRLAWTMSNPTFTQMEKARYRAKQAIEDRNWVEADLQLNEELRMKRESERLGYSTWDMSEVRSNMDLVRKNLP